MNHNAWAASWKARTAVASSGPLRDVKRVLRIVGCDVVDQLEGVRFQFFSQY